MSSITWKDITNELLQSSKTFKLFQIACPEGYNLEDSMQATEMNDQKVDVKSDLSSKYTLNNLIASKTVKHPSQLTLEQLVYIYDEVAGFEIMYMKEYPIAQSIYTFSYLYDREICKQNQYVLGIVDSINTFGSYFQDLLKQSMSMRDDDNTFSLFGFSKEKKSHEEVAEILLKLEKQLDNLAKSDKNQQKIANALNSRIKGRRFLHLLCKEMGNRFQNKNAEKIKKNIQSFKKRLDQIMQTLDLTKKAEGIFNQNIYKTLRANLSPRQIKYPNIQETYVQFKNMATQIDMFLPVPPAFSQILERIDELLSLPLNKLAKSYIVSMFFKPKADYLDSAIPLADAIGKDIVDWLSLKQNTLKSQKYQQLTTQTAAFMNQILLKMFLNKPRWQWQTSRIYQNFNYIVHISNQFDNTVDHKKEIQVISYAYYIGINHMIKQLQTGVQIQLYFPQEYGYIFYYMEYLFSISNRNSMLFIKKFDKGYMDAFDEKTLSNKIKKKVSPNMRKMYSSIIFNRGLHYYYNAMYKLFLLLITDGLIKEARNQKQRYISRFQIFRKVLFIKPAEYNAYREELQKIRKDRTGTISSIQQNLKQAQSLLHKLSILQQTDIFSHTKNQLQGLTKLCIRQSLQVMRYKMSKGVQKVTITKCHPHYVQVTL